MHRLFLCDVAYGRLFVCLFSCVSFSAVRSVATFEKRCFISPIKCFYPRMFYIGNKNDFVVMIIYRAHIGRREAGVINFIDSDTVYKKYVPV